MHLPLRLLAVLLPSLCSTAAPAQQARREPGADGEPLRAARFLENLRGGQSNGGVRLSGDLDLDGDVDLLQFIVPPGTFPVRGMQTWLAQGTRDGEPVFELAHELAFELGFSPFELARHVGLGDVTGDGLPDLLYERKDLAEVVGPSGVLVHAGLGDGSFGEPLLIETGGIVMGFVVGDCDGDGDSDVLLHDSGANFVRTLAWWHHDGESFVPSGTALDVTSLAPLRISGIDLEGDGITDAVAGTFNGFGTLLAFRTVAGSPTFHSTTVLPSVVGSIAQYCKSGDLDGDGYEDTLVVFDDFDADEIHLVVVLHTDSGYLAAPPQTFVNPTFDPVSSRDGVLADWDEDGDLDYVSQYFTWMENAGDATFAPAGKVFSSYKGGNDYNSLQVTDVDGDGHLDALSEWTLFRGDGDMPGPASVPPRDDYLLLHWSTQEDWEEDGDLDLVDLGILNLNQGDSSFVQHWASIPLGSNEHIAAWGDFDGDGFRDLVTALFIAQEYPDPPLFDRMRFFTGDEDGDYSLSSSVPSTIEIDTGGVSLSGDLDTDGDLDILVEDGFHANDGYARFGYGPVAAFSGLPLQALDIDGDQDLDLLVEDGSLLEILLNHGPGSGPSFEIRILGSYVTGQLESFLDADEDGDLDLAIVRPSQDTLKVFEQYAPGSFSIAVVLPSTELLGRADQMDVNGDGLLDLVVARKAPHSYYPNNYYQLLSSWVRRQGLAFSGRREWMVRDQPRVFGDFDGDGDRDALGNWLLENRQFDGPRDGWSVQYGLEDSTPGSGGIQPVLGGRGPFRLDTGPAVAVGRGRGGASGWLIAGRERDEVAYAGITLLIDPVQVVVPLVLGGPSDVPGAGTAVQPLPTNAALIGRTFTFQVVLVDSAAPGGFSATNGVEIRFGAGTELVR